MTTINPAGKSAVRSCIGCGKISKSSAIDYGCDGIRWVNKHMPLNFNFVSRSMFTGVSLFQYHEFAWCLLVTLMLTVMLK